MAKKPKKIQKKSKDKLSGVSKDKLVRKVKKLQEALHTREDYITHLERLSEAYENLSQLSGAELKDADNIIHAQEIIQSLMTQERIHAEDIIHAHEIVEQLSAREIDDARRIIEAQEAVQGLMSKERIEAEHIIQAHEIVESLSSQEIEEAYKTIEAHERIHGLSTMEKQRIDQEIRARETVSQLSSDELKNKDEDLFRVLEINRGISAILEESELLEKIVHALAQSLKADRAILFWIRDSQLESRSRYKIREKDIQDKAFKESLDVINKCRKAKTSQLVLHKKVQSGQEDRVLSMIAVPLIHLDSLQGVLYADKIGPEKTLYSREQFVAEIFAQQAVISLNNADLYKRLKKQNWELLHLINLKNEFIDRMSQHLLSPCEQLDQEMETVEKCGCESCSKQVENSRKISRKLKDTVARVLSLVEMEREVNDLTSDSVDFMKIIDQLREKYAGELDHRHISISIDLSKEFKHYTANNTIIRAILDELIGNAILYNREQGTVDIKGNSKGEYLVLKITDTGVGIARDELNLIFEQFYRSEHSAELNESGAGLGLYMVKSFISYYHGSLDVESKLGKGSTFTLSLLAK